MQFRALQATLEITGRPGLLPNRSGFLLSGFRLCGFRSSLFLLACARFRFSLLSS